MDAGTTAGELPGLETGFHLPSDYDIRFPDRAAFVACSFQAFIGNFRPELLRLPRCRLMLMRAPFSVFRSPRHLTKFPYGLSV
jgi:hypothetical protein